MKELKTFLKAVLTAILIFIVIISNVSVWNAAAGASLTATAVTCSVINFVLEGIALYYFAKNFLFKSTEKIETK